LGGGLDNEKVQGLFRKITREGVSSNRSPRSQLQRLSLVSDDTGYVAAAPPHLHGGAMAGGLPVMQSRSNLTKKTRGTHQLIEKLVEISPRVSMKSKTEKGRRAAPVGGRQHPYTR
jgi:hypothetical protein